MDQIFNKRQISCPKVHIFGARETTAPVGFGSSSTVVDAVKAAHSGATSEAIKYPACGGQSQCGGVQYAASASQGATAVVSAINDFHKQCPDTQIVLVGYSQGGQIMDDALCGGKLTGTALDAIKAAIFMGDPMFVAGLDYEVGTCKTQGVSFLPKINIT
jgi:acetylxylan esterase